MFYLKFLIDVNNVSKSFSAYLIAYFRLQSVCLFKPNIMKAGQTKQLPYTTTRKKDNSQISSVNYIFKKSIKTNIEFTPMPQSTKQVLKEYIESKGRVAYKLQQLTKLFRYYKNGVHCISKLLKGTQNPIKIFKILILLHHCYVEGVLELAGVMELFGLMKHVPKKCFQQQLQIKLCQQVIPQYKLYLQKCFSLQQQKRLQRQGIKSQKIANTQKLIQKRSIFSNSQRIIKANLPNDPHSQTSQIPAAKIQIFNSKDQQLYAKLNLLKSGLSFMDILFTFGRYFQKNHQYIVDFNIIVAKDVKNAYDQVRVLLQSKVQLFDNSVKAVLESVHQKMYIVYYNCYFFKYSKKYEPIWIDLPYSKLQQIEEPCPISLEQTLQGYKKIILTQNKHKSPMMQKPQNLKYERTGKGLFSQSRSRQDYYQSSNKNEGNIRDKKNLNLDSTYEKDDRSQRVNSGKMENIHEDISQFVVRDFDHDEQSARKDEDGDQYEYEHEHEHGGDEDRDQYEDEICNEGMTEQQCIYDNYAVFQDLRRVIQDIDQYQKKSSELINTQL